METTPLKKPSKPGTVCFCKSIYPGLLACKLTGLLPITTVHEQGRCIFKKSYPWIVYSGILVLLYFLQFVFATDVLHIFQIGHGKSLHGILASINDIIYSAYVAALAFLNAIHCNKFAKTFNKFAPIMKEGIYCGSARRVMLNIQYGFITVVITITSVQYITIAWLHYSESYQSNFDFRIILNRFIQNVPFVFYILFTGSCTLFVACLVCFEKLTINALKFTPVHPMKGIDETSNERDFMGVIKFLMCRDSHPLSNHMLKLKSAELVEFLRILHEDICLIMYEMNNCLNPQILVHTVVELTVLIIHWYAVIIYAAFDFVAPLASTIHCLNCLFVFLHTIGLFVFLRNAQQLRNIVSFSWVNLNRFSYHPA